MKMSRMANLIEQSLTRKLFGLAQQYSDVIDLTLGDPDLKTPLDVREAACRAIMEGKTRYSANAGLIELRRAIAANLKKEYQLIVDPETEIVVTVGGMGALYLALAAVVDPGDEVIIPAPYYVNYVQMTQMCGGTPVIIETSEQAGFAVTAQEVESAITDRTVAVVLNTPCNPTGEIMSASILEEIANIARKHDLYVITDEVYRSIIYDGAKHNSILHCKGMTDRTVLVDSCSKRFAMTGWRIGYACAPSRLIASMTKMQENIAACAPLPSQYAAIEALTGNVDTSYISEEFTRRRDIVVEGINRTGCISCRKPKGTFYAFANISGTGLSSVDFAYRLLEGQHVAVVPGVAYGPGYDTYVRISFTISSDKLAEAMERIGRFVDSLGGLGGGVATG